MSILKGRPKPPIPDFNTGKWIAVIPGVEECEFWFITNGSCTQAYPLFEKPVGVGRAYSCIAGYHNLGYESLIISEKTLNEWSSDDLDGQDFCEYCRAETRVVPIAFHDQFMAIIEDMKQKALRPARRVVYAYSMS
jgi:hypothetical protein